MAQTLIPYDKIDGLVVSACLLRNTAGEDGDWQFIENASHTTLNCSRVVTDDKYITVERDMVTSAISMIVTVDNDLAKAGYTCGPSGGGRITKIAIFDMDGNPVNPRTLDTSVVPRANLNCFWISTPRKS